MCNYEILEIFNCRIMKTVFWKHLQNSPEIATITFVIPLHPSAWKNSNPKGRELLELYIGFYQIGRNIPISVNTEQI
jgi:hypothetical protein